MGQGKSGTGWDTTNRFEEQNGSYGSVFSSEHRNFISLLSSCIFELPEMFCQLINAIPPRCKLSCLGWSHSQISSIFEVFALLLGEGIDLLSEAAREGFVLGRFSVDFRIDGALCAGAIPTLAFPVCGFAAGMLFRECRPSSAAPALVT